MANGISHNELLVEAQNRLIENIQASEKRYQELVNHLRDVVFHIDSDFKWTFLNPAWQFVTGFCGIESIGSTLFQHLHELDSAACRLAFFRLLQGDIQYFSRELSFTAANGKVLLLELYIRAVKDETGRYSGLTGTLSDITERRLAEDELRVAAYAFDTIEAIVVTDCQANIIRTNQAFSQITGYSGQEVIGRNIGILKSGEHDTEFYRQMWSELNQHGRWQGEVINRKKNGDIFPEWLVATAVRSEQGEITNFVASFTDITERKEAERQIKHLAYHDALTDLPNRRLLIEHLESALPLTKRHGFFAAVLYVDLDNFKLINDTHGHNAGDQVLIEIAYRLKQNLRAEDIVSRIGGDEFIIYVTDLGTDKQHASHILDQLAETVKKYISAPIVLNNTSIHISASIGAAIFPGDDDQVEDVMRYSDVAMYQAKNARRNRIRFYNHEMQVAVDERRAYEAELQRAFVNDEFCLYFQPQINLSSGNITGVEALLRWNHPDKGLVQPADFIPQLEESGQIIEIGTWVLRHTCDWMKRWQCSGHDKLRVSVNVSAAQFRHRGFNEQIETIVSNAAIDSSLLELELAENVAIKNIDETIRKMHKLKRLGLNIALDDFGSGYSSLAYLKRLPINTLKIDKSFIQDVPNDAYDVAIVEATMVMVKHLGLRVVAEGIENRQQLQFMQRNDCDIVQGFYFSEPLTGEAFTHLIAGNIVLRGKGAKVLDRLSSY
ncbi:sensor domain-containing protein [Amphritea sp. HPY]|uniref:sensor domain-containing protein n=1 Tax=Amphritea sp. HPY TaxID=3421652 RepID=UPI003D7DE07B